jgi:hypothetical protein
MFFFFFSLFFIFFFTTSIMAWMDEAQHGHESDSRPRASQQAIELWFFPKRDGIE